MKRVIFLIIIFVVIIYFQYPYINETQNTFEILQYNNPNKSYFENMISEKKISIFTDIPYDLDYKNIKSEFFTKDFLNTLKSNKEYTKILNKNLDFYKIPLCIESKVDLLYLDKPTQLTYQKNYRLLLLNLKNTIKITLFYPNQKENLYFNKKNKSSIDFFNVDYDKYSKLNNVKYIEILLHKNQMIYIPFKWIYILSNHMNGDIEENENQINEENNDSVIVKYTNESIFSKFLKNNT